MPYTPIETYEEFCNQLGQVYINAAVSECQGIAAAANDLHAMLDNALGRYVLALFAGESVTVSQEDRAGILETWADHDYPPIAKAVRVWALAYGTPDLATRLALKFGQA